MNTLALIPYAGTIIWLVIVALVIWVIFYVLPLPTMVRTILAVAVAMILLLWLLPGCADYQKTVSSRSVAGYAKAGEDVAGGGVVYTVTYR